MLKHAAAVAVVWLASVSIASAQQCLHGAAETSANRVRREEALRMAHLINLAQVIIVGPGPLMSRRYRPLEELANIPPTPRGFQVQFHTDGATYAFALKDTLDPCHYAIFSDQDKRIYEATPNARAVVVPATGTDLAFIVSCRPFASSNMPSSCRPLPSAPRQTMRDDEAYAR